MSTAGRSWAALAAFLMAASAGALLLPAAVLDWQPELALTQPWRAVTAAFVHWSDQHLLANLGATLVVGVFGWAAALPREQTVAWVASWPLSHTMLLLRPDVLHYGGLSGMLHGGVAITCLWLLCRTRGARRLVGAWVGSGLVIKLALENPWGPGLQRSADWDITIVPLAHTTGALAGLLCGAAALFWAHRKKPHEH